MDWFDFDPRNPVYLTDDDEQRDEYECIAADEWYKEKQLNAAAGYLTQTNTKSHTNSK